MSSECLHYSTVLFCFCFCFFKKSKYEKSFHLRAATVFMLIYQESESVGIEAESVCLLLTFVLEKKLDDDIQTK